MKISDEVMNWVIAAAVLLVLLAIAFQAADAAEPTCGLVAAADAPDYVYNAASDCNGSTGSKITQSEALVDLRSGYQGMKLHTWADPNGGRPRMTRLLVSTDGETYHLSTPIVETGNSQSVGGSGWNQIPGSFDGGLTEHWFEECTDVATFLPANGDQAGIRMVEGLEPCQMACH